MMMTLTAAATVIFFSVLVRSPLTRWSPPLSHGAPPSSHDSVVWNGLSALTVNTSSTFTDVLFSVSDVVLARMEPYAQGHQEDRHEDVLHVVVDDVDDAIVSSVSLDDDDNDLADSAVSTNFAASVAIDTADFIESVVAMDVAVSADYTDFVVSADVPSRYGYTPARASPTTASILPRRGMFRSRTATIIDIDDDDHGLNGEDPGHISDAHTSDDTWTQVLAIVMVCVTSLWMSQAGRRCDTAPLVTRTTGGTGTIDGVLLNMCELALCQTVHAVVDAADECDDAWSMHTSTVKDAMYAVSHALHAAVTGTVTGGAGGADADARLQATAESLDVLQATLHSAMSSRINTYRCDVQDTQRAMDAFCGTRVRRHSWCGCK